MVDVSKLANSHKVEACLNQYLQQLPMPIIWNNIAGDNYGWDFTILNDAFEEAAYVEVQYTNRYFSNGIMIPLRKFIHDLNKPIVLIHYIRDVRKWYITTIQKADKMLFDVAYFQDSTRDNRLDEEYCFIIPYSAWEPINIADTQALNATISRLLVK